MAIAPETLAACQAFARASWKAAGRAGSAAVGVRAKLSLDLELEVASSGVLVVAGVDEAGRGAWAGPLAVGVAVVRAKRLLGGLGAPDGLGDSKALSESRREEIFPLVASWCDAWAVGYAEAPECDQLGMTRASSLAAWRALASLPPSLRPDVVLLDGGLDYVTPRTDGEERDRGLVPCHACGPGRPLVRNVVKGDSSCASIAAASVLAKVSRDRLMRAYARSYPDMGFEKHKGYPTSTHREAVALTGMTPLHRRSWSW